MRISTDFFIPPIVPERTKSVRLQFEFDDEANLNVDEFWDFCSQNDKLQIELTKENVFCGQIFSNDFQLFKKTRHAIMPDFGFFTVSV